MIIRVFLVLLLVEYSSIPLREGYRISMLENRMPKRILRPNGSKITGA
jgi:hypothetical protein